MIEAARLGPVLCIGSATMDLVWKASGAPRPDGKTLADGFDQRPGGGTVNAALAIARQGGQAEVWARLGDDLMGRMLRDLVQEAGVSAHGLVEAKGHATTVASCVLHEGKRSIVVRADLDLPPCLDRVNLARVEEAGAVLATQRWPEAAAPALERARELGIPGVLNMEITKEPTPESFVRSASHVVFSAEGLARWTGKADPVDGLREAQRRLPDSQVMGTFGEKGVMLVRPQEDKILWFRAVKAGDPVDTLGAGDVFQGALAHALSEGKDVVRAIQEGLVASAIKVTRDGVANAAPTRDELDDGLRRHATALRPVPTAALMTPKDRGTGPAQEQRALAAVVR